VGSVSLVDGVIEEVHTYEECKAVQMHHNNYLSPGAVDRINNYESGIFIVNEYGIETQWRTSVPDWVLRKIEEQITIIK
jgi:hypothetical protein